MSNTETWGIVLRDRASGAEQWVACEVKDCGDGRWSAHTASGSTIAGSRWDAVVTRAQAIVNHDRNFTTADVKNPEEYAAHMEGVRSALVADEVERLRADLDATRGKNRYADVLFMVGRFVGVEAYESEPIIDAIRSAVRASIAAERARADQLADALGAIGRRVCAESCDRDAILNAIDATVCEAYEFARRDGEVSMREAAASWCGVAGYADIAASIREFALTGSQPAQRPADGEAYDAARREGAEAMREAAAKACEGDRTAFVAVFIAEHGRPPTERELAPFIIRALPTVSKPAQSPAASDTPEAPTPFADAAARARDAARGRVAVTP